MFGVGFVLYSLACLVCARDVYADGPIVDTSYGSVQGVSTEDDLDRPYDVFKGIPFALPPLGELRFTKPQPPEPWDGVRDASEWGTHCVHFLAQSYEDIGLSGNSSEDCLYLNVFVPFGVDEASSLPVMFWIHGGGYIMGSSALYDAEALALAGPVVVVTTNYRLGPIGFLSTEDAAAPGNYGLWDVQAALTWVRDNIAAFGGDPARVTVFGQSAGGAMTSHVAISPACRGLFRRAIALSGGATGFFGHNYPGAAAASTTTLARAVGCRRLNSTDELVDCLREVDADELDWWGFLAVITLRLHLPNFMPSIDGDFVPQLPRRSWQEGAAADIDYITGYTEHDSAGFTLVNLHGTNTSYNMAFTKETMNIALAYLLNVYPNSGDAMDAIYEAYPDMHSNDTDTRTVAFTQMTTDWWFGSASSFEASQHARETSTSTYHYNFNYRNSFIKFPEEWVEGSHYHDLYSVFGEPYGLGTRQNRLGPDYDFDDTDREVSRTMMNYYTNFAHTGNPNVGPNDVEVTWPQYSDSEAEENVMLRFRDEPQVEIESEDDQERYQFWLDEFMDIARPDDVLGEDDYEPWTEEEVSGKVEEAITILEELLGNDRYSIDDITERLPEMLERRRKRLSL